MLDKTLKPNKPGRWWVKFAHNWTEVFIVEEQEGKLQIFAAQTIQYEGDTWYWFPITEEDRLYGQSYLWETMELKENNRQIEYCYPLTEKPPWE